MDNIDVDRVRFAMFCDYLNELQCMKGLQPLGALKLGELYTSYARSKNSVWGDIYAEGGETVVGFLIIGHSPNCHPDADFYIEEAYIKPEYRRQGYMSAAVSRFISEHQGTYCLFILNNNTAAQHFWPKLFAELGYLPCDLADVGAGDQYCTQYGYRKFRQ